MEVTMKRFLLSMLLCSGITILPAAAAARLRAVAQGPLALHAPAQGNLQLGDNGHAAGIQRGIIMDTIINNPDFASEHITIAQFMGIPGQPIQFSYQQIIQRVRQSTDAIQSVAVIEAFEKALMHQYHYENYAMGSYQPWQSIFITGIKYSWINPIKWVNPKYWISDQDPELNQILEEMSFLAKVAYKHSLVTANRINATVESYRHWRRNMALTVIAYFAADAYKHGISQSSLNDLYHGGLSHSHVVLAKFLGNMYSGSRFAAHATAYGANAAYNVAKPVVDFVLYGKDNKGPQIAPKSLQNLWYNKQNKKEKTYPEPKTPAAQTRWRDHFKDAAASYIKQAQDRYYKNQ